MLNLAKARRAWLCVKYGSRYYWGMVETVPFFVRERTVDSEGEGGGLAFFKNKYPGRQTP